MVTVVHGRQSSRPDSGTARTAADKLTHISRRTPKWARMRSRSSERRIRVEVLEHLTLMVDFESRECAWFWRPARGKALRMRNPPGLLRPLDDANVLALLGQSYVEPGFHYRKCRMPSLSECQNAMRLEIARNPVLRNWATEWRQLVREVLGSVLDLAERSRTDAEVDLALSDFNRVWQREGEFVDVANNAPELLPLLNLWFASGQEQGVRSPALNVLREAICSSPDCGPATWRWLLHWGVSSSLGFVLAVEPDIQPSRRWRVITRFLGLWTRAGLPPALPPAIVREWGRRENPMSSFSDYCPDRLAIFARQISKNLSSQRPDEIAEQLMRLRDVAVRPDSNQKRSGWKWLDRELQQLCPVYPCDPATLNALRQRPPEEIVVSGVRFVSLSTPAEVLEEGRALNHCMADHPLGIARSGDLHYSLRDFETNDRIGTLSVTPCRESLVLKELAGPGNSDPSPRMLSAAQALCQVLAAPRQLAREGSGVPRIYPPGSELGCP